MKIQYKLLFFSFFFQIWLPDVEVLNLKMFRALDVLSKLQGLWVSQYNNVLYVLATRVTFICAMSFDAFPLDVQTCLLQVRIGPLAACMLLLLLQLLFLI